MRVLIAPGAFKQGPAPVAVADALARGWSRVRRTDAVRLLPLADGGDGTLDAVAAALPAGARLELGPDLEALRLDPSTLLIELASVCGLARLPRPDPLEASTFRLGEAMARACDAQTPRLCIALGGSASTDGGAGALAALGLRALDESGRVLPLGGGALAGLADIELGALRRPPPLGVELWTDVTHPLLGPDGAARVFGPQKGADPAQVARLEAGLSRWADLLGGEPATPGAGAAGGTAYGLATLWGARIVSGAKAVAARVGLDAALDSADLVITGEGRFDSTSAAGKVVGELVRRCGERTLPTALVAGQLAALAPWAWRALDLASLAGGVEAARASPLPWLEAAGETLARQWR